MKKNYLILLLNTLTLSFFTLSVFSQTVYESYQDGIVVFQLKKNSFLSVKSKNRSININDVDFVRNLKDVYNINSLIQLHPNHKDFNLSRTFQIDFNKIKLIDNLIENLNAVPEIEYAEKKELHKSFLTPNDPSYTNSTNGQWALFKINAAQAWDLSTGNSNVVVAVTDNAINVNHPDLVNKMLTGYDAVDQDNDPTGCGSNDGFHGSHVSGIVGAETNNNAGIASIGYDVSILPVKIGNCSGSLVAGYEGIIWAADNGADVINMSWGGSGYSTYGQNVCDYAANAGSILVAAAGNNNVNSIFYPAGYNNVISVASTTTNDAKSSFSNYGAWIDISAPGSSILSCNASTGYQVTQGTSMASPLVAGLMGLMKSYAPNASNQDLINCLYSSATNIDGANSNYVNQLGAGRIDAYQALLCLNAFSYALDAAITDVNSPSNSICGTTISPEITLRNFGSTTLNSVDIVYQVGNSASQTYNWTGSLASGQSVSVLLPSSQTFNAGSYSFTASTNNPNGGSDQNASNDQETSNFSIVPNGDNLNVSITTDCYGDETTWLIQDANGNTIISGGPYTQNNTNQTYNTSVCLNPGCYDFFINDSYGDGMHGSQWNGCSVDGDYNIQNSNGTNLVQMTAPNADFGNGTSHNFCVVNPNIANDASLESISSPNGPTCNSSVSPTVSLANYGSQSLSSVDINYGFNGTAIQTFNWTGNLSSGQSTTVTLPNLTITGNPQSFMVYTTSPNGSSDQNTSNDTLTNQVIFFANSLPLPFSEDFESNSFSTNSWLVENPDNSITWDIVSTSGTTPGNKSAKLNFYQYTQLGQRDRLISSPINFNGYTSLDLSFEHAYRRFDQNSTDSLIVSISIDCGQSFVRLFELGENGTGSFATAYTNTADFTPSQSSEWCMGTIGANCFSINLDSYIGNSSVILKFEGYNAGTNGNNLFIDNININGNPSLIAPSSDFNSSITNLCLGDTVNFTDLSTTTINSWSWDFGDGNTSTQQNPSHVYTSSGTYSVSLTVNNAVGSDSTTKINYIVINNNDLATIGNIGPVCISTSSVNLTSNNPNGSWSGNGISNSTTGTFNPSLVGVGNHTVSFTTNGACPYTDTAVVTVISQADATISTTGKICISDGIITMNAASPGGLWSGSGITNANNGTFDPTSAGTGTHTITYNIAGACGDNDQTTVNVVSFIDPAIISTNPMCSNDSAINLASLNSGGTWSGSGITNANIGTFDPSVSGNGSHVITYTIAGSCGGTDQETIVVNNALDPTITLVDTVCVNSTPINLIAASSSGVWSGNGITNTTNGTFAPSVAGVGSHLIVYNISGLCPTFDQITIVVEGATNATIFPINPICINNGTINLNAASPNGVWTGNGIIDSINGVFDPSIAGVGNHNISYTIAGACGNFDQTTIQVDDVQNSTINSVGPLCITNGTVTLSAATTGGTWSGNGIIDPQNGIFDPVQAGAGNHIITYAITSYCGSVSSQTITVIENIATFVFSFDTLCVNSGNMTINPTQQGGVWSGNGVNSNGVFNPSSAGSGTHNISYSFSGQCASFHTESIVVLDNVIASINYVNPLCVYDSIITLTGSPSGGTWSGNGILNVNNGTFSPSNAGVGIHAITYTVSGLCGDDDISYLSVDECTNINELYSSYFAIFPNPTIGLLTINYKLQSIEQPLEIYNSVGEIVYRDVLNGGNDIMNEKIIDLGKLESGIYFIKVENLIKKVIVN